MFEHFDERSIKVMACGNVEADRQKNPYFGTEHLLLGLAMEKTGIGAKALNEVGANLERIKQKVSELNYDPSIVANEENIEKISQKEVLGSFSSNIRFAPRCKKVLQRSLMIAEELNDKYVHTEALLLALLDEDEGPSNEILTKMQLDKNALRQIVARLKT